MMCTGIGELLNLPVCLTYHMRFPTYSVDFSIGSPSAFFTSEILNAVSNIAITMNSISSARSFPGQALQGVVTLQDAFQRILKLLTDDHIQMQMHVDLG